MAGSSPSAELIAKLPGLLSSGAFSDITLACGGKKFKVHKVVLCTQSEVFRKLLDGKFMEAGATHVSLPEDEPCVLQVLIHYFYHFELDTTDRPATAGLWTFLVHVYAIADKYDVPALRRLIAKSLDDVCDPTKSIDDFIAVLRVIDACTAESTLWDIMLPKVRANITLLLQDESFRELAMELPSLTLPLLGMLDQFKCMEHLLRKQISLGLLH